MDITWYSSIVTFFQKIRLNKPVTTISGKVEYMTCNNEVCIPSMHEFNVDVRPGIKTH